MRKARLSVDYAILEAARLNDPDSYNLVYDDETGNKRISQDILERLNRFRMTCKDSDITYMNETRFTVEEYLDFYSYTLKRAEEDNIAVNKEVTLLQLPKKYANEDPLTLTDGAFGGTSFYANWLGFEGNDLEAIIDLKNESEIDHLSCDFLQVVNHVVFFPVKVSYYYSQDGENYIFLDKALNKKPLTKESKINDIQSFSVEFDPVKARYVKVVADNMGMAPVWHHGAGTPSWIFADEIIVR